MYITINDKYFWECVKNTWNDFLVMGNDNEFVKSIGKLFKDRKVTVSTIMDLALVIETRKSNLDYAKSLQDEVSFSIVNKEHRYMENVLSRYFDIQVLPNGLLAITQKKQ